MKPVKRQEINVGNSVKMRKTRRYGHPENEEVTEPVDLMELDKAIQLNSLTNKFIMKIGTERNPYLKRIFSEQPHKYSYDIESGKYHLLDSQGKTLPINRTGTFHPKFRPNYSGFVNHKSRYNDAPADPSVLHFAPDPNPDLTYFTPHLDKFAGYAQFPYKLQKEFPAYLTRKDPRLILKGEINRKQTESKKAQSLLSSNKNQKGSLILQYSVGQLKERDGQTYFQGAFESMTETRPLPKQKKKTCYNHKCKYLRQWNFDQKGKIEARERNEESLNANNTLGISFHQEGLQREMKESKLLSTMALTVGSLS